MNASSSSKLEEHTMKIVVLNDKELTPKERFLRWAYLVSEDRLLAGLITKSMHDQLTRHLVNGTEPNEDLLRASFPNATKVLLEGRDPWSHASVTNFWLHTKKRCEMPVDTRIATVDTIINDEFVAIRRGSQAYAAVNFYRLPLRAGDSIHLFGRIVIEAAPAFVRSHQHQQFLEQR